MTTDTAAFRATTRTIERPDEPLAWLGADGFAWIADDHGIVTSGVATTVAPRDASAALQAIAAPGVIACGALPFTDAVSAPLVIPARVLRYGPQGATVTEIDGATLGPAPKLAQTPRRFTVDAQQDLASWDNAVASALALIDADTIQKVVLAREVRVAADHPFSIAEVLTTLARTQPGCFVYAHGGFVGASPELLVRRTARSVVSKPMAGTVARQASIAADDEIIAGLRASMKDNAEHRYVVDAVVAALAAHCDEIVVSDPEPVRLATVTHLTTEIHATRRNGDAASALDLALALHPTPAVGGTPTRQALAAISALEPFDRGCYGGPVGWVDANGDGEFAVALRCGELHGTTARLLAGAGIVDGSDPDLEWAETQAKLEPMLRALVRP